MRTVVDPRFTAELRHQLLHGRADLSQAELARRAHVSRSHLSRVINGQAMPSVEIARALDDALDAKGRLTELVASPMSDDDADRFAATCLNPAGIGAAGVESLAQVLAAHRALDDTMGSAALLRPVAVQMEQLTGLVGSTRGPVRPLLMSVAGQFAQFAGWLYLSAGRPAESDQWLRTALLWAVEAGDPDLIATVVSYQAHHAWLDVRPAVTLGLALAAMRDGSVYPGQLAYDGFQAARAHAAVGELAEADRLVEVADQYATRCAGWSGVTPPWQYQRQPWVWLLERGLVLRYAARHQPARAVRAVADLRAGVDAVPVGWRSSEWFAEYLTHLAQAHIAADQPVCAVGVLGEARRIAAGVSARRVLGQVAAAERRLRVGRPVSV